MMMSMVDSRMASMDHDVDFVMMDQMLMRDVKLLDELKRPDNVQWNVDDDNQYNNDDNLLGVDEMNRRRLIVVEEDAVDSDMVELLMLQLPMVD
jgi:hypothetical protein